MSLQHLYGLTSTAIRRNMQCMKSVKLFVSALSITMFVVPTTSVAADKSAPTRPPIVGVAWIGLRTANMAATRKFYTEYLGMPEQTGVKDEANRGFSPVGIRMNCPHA